jgi:hypothetical protein
MFTMVISAICSFLLLACVTKIKIHLLGGHRPSDVQAGVRDSVLS